MRHYLDLSIRLGEVICIVDPGEAAERDRRMIPELAGSDGTPVDTDIAALGPGLWCEDSPHAGELSVQGIVEDRGRRGRFDDIAGRGWILIGRGSNPADALTAEQHHSWNVIGGRCVQTGAASSGCDGVDVEGTHARWLDSIGAEFVILRPDFYVAARAADAAQLRSCLDAVLSGLHLTTRPAPATARGKR